MKIPAVIIAAGMGTRMENIGENMPKCLIPIAGRTIIEWIIRSLKKSRIDEIVVVVGYMADSIIMKLDALDETDLKFSYIHNELFEKPNGVSALLGIREALKKNQRCLLMMSDHLIEPFIIEKAIAIISDNSFLMVDPSIDSVFDIDDATKVSINCGRPIAIGKNIRKYEAVDVGVFSCNEDMLSGLESTQSRGLFSLTDAVKNLIEEDKFEVISIPDGSKWIDIDTPRAAAFAESMIINGGFLSGLV